MIVGASLGGSVEVVESADVGLVAVDSGREKSRFSGQILDADADGVPMDLLMGGAVH